jgi:uncharacterized protein YbbC (DUF1343 family)
MRDLTDPFASGLEVCLQTPPPALDGARFGLLMNQASVTSDWRYACDALAERFSGQLAAIFSPQHGLWGEEQANMIESPHAVHKPLGLPVYSLYSKTRRPTREMLRGLDCFVIDLQDVGTRVYTFIWTISYCLEACAEARIPVVILDRPNPIGGMLVEGPLLSPEFGSFVGRSSIPMRHGLTIGELAQLINCELGIDADLSVVPIQGWRRELSFDQLDRAWIPPSPNLPRIESLLAYPGQVLLEGTNLSEGRGTTRPFEVVGAPYVDPDRLCKALDEAGLPGVRFLPIRFAPAFDKWKNRDCGGVSLHIIDRINFRPFRTTVAILAAVRNLWPADFAWLPPPYEYETVKPPIDILFGSARLRETLDGLSGKLQPAEFGDLCALDGRAWHNRTAGCQIYP